MKKIKKITKEDQCIFNSKIMLSLMSEGKYGEMKMQ